MDVNQIFKDLATMVHEQGEVVDSIEANVEAAQVHVSQASTQLSQARQYQVSGLSCFHFLLNWYVSLFSCLYVIYVYIKARVIYIETSIFLCSGQR